MRKGTAVLLFTRTPKEEAIARPYHRSLGLKLVKRLIGRAKLRLKESGFDSFVLDSNNQYGDTFGERLSNAFHDIFESGYDRVIAIGNDAPTLTSQDIAKADSHLNKESLVIGPSSNGGVYLLGLHKSAFDEDLFIKLPWQTPDLVREIRGNYASALKLKGSELDLKFEVEDYDSLGSYISISSVCDSLAKWAQSILSSIVRYTLTIFSSTYHRRFSLYCGLRAPPLHF
ncbi:MAG: DUF2064 domain-containing protein [Bacteroidota bacterium]